MEDFERPFEKIWDPKYFQQYCEWLKGNLTENIIGSLQTMSSDSSQWNQTNLRNADSAGPFKYGFVFKDKWDGNRNYKINSAIHPLLSPLRELQGCLQGSPAPPVQSSRASESSHVPSVGTSSPGSGSSGSYSTYGSSDHYQTEYSKGQSENADTSDSSEGSSTASIVGASVGTLGGTAALGGLGYFLRGFLFGV
ncbi:hypothetical protein X943_002011 [Babesia divergens]|uniref:Uncharacterized protein n=1 Tax=Babesia divergens TaxID=32595 RepID=A0AAD9GE08_BABDI|nr:hypothetical protein X943_002011 [Babesia divergens]